jgi:hypothetical protein
MVEADIETVRQNRCPRCGNWGFIAGPRGGAGQNIYCCNPECRAAFMVAPRHRIAFVEHVGEAPDCHYPPKIHILRGGFAVCNFSNSFTVDNGPPPRILPMVPDMWPIGHSWVGIEDFDLATCKTCRERGRS